MITNHTVESLQAFEDDVAECFNRGEIRAPIHLSGGNEQQLIDIFQHVNEGDWVATNWRSHYHCLLKGVPPAELKADILAGKSITLNYPSHRIISSAIVGGVLPIAVGIAWAIKRLEEKGRVWAFLGDMAARSGVFMECVTYSHSHELPITFVIEDNGKSVGTFTSEVWGDNYNVPEDLIEQGWPKTSMNGYRYELPWPHSGAGKGIEF